MVAIDIQNKPEFYFQTLDCVEILRGRIMGGAKGANEGQSEHRGRKRGLNNYKLNGGSIFSTTRNVFQDS